MNLDAQTVLTHLPLTDLPLLNDLVSFWRDWLAHPMPDTYWDAISPRASYEQVLVPALNISGWYDFFLWGTYQNYLGMRQ